MNTQVEDLEVGQRKMQGRSSSKPRENTFAHVTGTNVSDSAARHPGRRLRVPVSNLLDKSSSLEACCRLDGDRFGDGLARQAHLVPTRWDLAW